MYSTSIQNLINAFSNFPTVGPRTAQRFVFYLINSSKEQVEELLKAIAEVKNKIKLCPGCGKSFENSQENLCAICSHPMRDKTLLCIVEKEIDLEAIEKTGQFKGLYFILTKENMEQRVSQFIQRIKNDGIKEIILALNPTHEGQTACLFLKRQIAPYKIKTSQLGIGLPLGGELEYADEETLAAALLGRN